MPEELPGEGRLPRFPAVTVLALMMGIFAVGSEELVISPLLVEASASFRTSVAVMGLSVTVYGVAQGGGALCFAPLADKITRRASLALAMGLFIAGTVTCGLAPGIGVFMTGRALSGLAAGAFVPAAYAYAGDQIAYRHRARAMGIIVSSWSLSLVLGVPLGSFAGQREGWRFVFGVLAVVGILVAAVLVRVREENPAVPPGPASDAGAGPALTWARALTAPRAAGYLLATFLNMLGFYGLYTYLGSAFQYRFGPASPLTSVMILIYGLGFAASPVTGKWADAWGKDRTLTALLAGLAPALLIIPLAMRVDWLLPVALFSWGAMQSLAVTLLSTLLSECSPRYRGTILAVYSLAVSLAVAAGAALLGPLFISGGIVGVGTACAVITLAACAASYRARGRVGAAVPQEGGQGSGPR